MEEASPELYEAVLHIIASNLTRTEMEVKLVKLGIPTIVTKFQAIQYLKKNPPVDLAYIVLFDVCPKDCLLFWK